ncbi:type III-B CRISPR-associated protein Cas10/Cmr2 [Planctomycetales bacterium]|nr:type III-B CRISPR-associated protein Cas10/Cmr2 [Planctomycetales bacterium]GHT00746.1 type III-B CRISPR-associated protein Cas10/Cmr2 [Planctomycetales bacterium]GHT04416.1 type III-B CRISPR-associated protein Cas10/Cmr2 [Planctomycetales bacterium]
MSDENNQKYLLAISLGPVQGFIAAARKTRDLWFGSYLLSEIAKAAAKHIAANGGELIFPGVDDAALEQTSVANVILAIVKNPPAPDEKKDGKITAIAKYAREVEKAAKARWRKFADDAHRKAARILRDELWQQQINDFVEFYAAWVPYDDENYVEKRRRVMRLLAGRKNLRDFKQSSGMEGVAKNSLTGANESVFIDDPKEVAKRRIPKSSLDGANETVLPKNLDADWRHSLQIADGEQLDAVGMVKRCATKEHFPSTVEIAVKPLGQDAVEKVRESKDEDNDAEVKKLREKSPYYAIIHADGDRIGKVIAAQQSPDAHREFSRALGTFAESVKPTIKEHGGACVYSGGDDVLGFLPLNTALECARKLHDDFADQLSGFRDEGAPSLSVGLVIVHYHEMLNVVLDFARGAESTAKKPNKIGEKNAAKDDTRWGERDGLAIEEYCRSGAPVKIRERWGNGADALDRRLVKWADGFATGDISAKFPYDLRELGKLYRADATASATAPMPPEAITAAVLQMIKHKNIKCESLKEWAKHITTVAALKSFSDEMLIAQTFGAAKKKGGE